MSPERVEALGLVPDCIGPQVESPCARLDDGSVKCWGQNNYGQAIVGTATAIGNGAGSMGDNLLPMSLGTGRTVKLFGAGTNHACVVLDNDVVKCGGNNSYGELGYEDIVQRGDSSGTVGDDLLAVNLGTGLSAVTALANTWFASCATP